MWTNKEAYNDIKTTKKMTITVKEKFLWTINFVKVKGGNKKKTFKKIQKNKQNLLKNRQNNFPDFLLKKAFDFIIIIFT